MPAETAVRNVARWWRDGDGDGDGDGGGGVIETTGKKTVACALATITMLELNSLTIFDKFPQNSPRQ